MAIPLALLSMASKCNVFAWVQSFGALESRLLQLTSLIRRSNWLCSQARTSSCHSSDVRTQLESTRLLFDHLHELLLLLATKKRAKSPSMTPILLELQLTPPHIILQTSLGARRR